MPGLTSSFAPMAVTMPFCSSVKSFFLNFAASPAFGQDEVWLVTGGGKGITAAVVGVILNLSVWFALNVLFESVTEKSWGPVAIPTPQLSALDITAVSLTILAGALIFRLKLGMGTVLVLMSVAGLVAHNI